MVEVFKTDVTEAAVAAELLTQLKTSFPGTRFNFDLSDCDNILRAEGPAISHANISLCMKNQGYQCVLLE